MPPNSVGPCAGEVAHGGGVPDVAHARQQPVAAVEPGGRPASRSRVAAAGGDVRAFGEQGADGGEADARTAAGDEYGAVGEGQIHGSGCSVDGQCMVKPPLTATTCPVR